MRPRLVNRCRRTPLVVKLSTVTFVALLTAWSFLTPLMSAPDESNHADLIFHLAEGGNYPEYDERRISTGAVSLTLVHSYVLQHDDTTQEVTSGDRTPDTASHTDFGATFADLGGDENADNWWNQLPQHPPLYYWASSAVVRVTRVLSPGPSSMHREARMLRFSNVLLMSPLPVLAWMATRRLGADDHVAGVASLLPLAIPQLTHVGSAINNDNLFIVLCSVLAVLLASVLRGDLRLRTAGAAGVVAGLAWMTKGFGALLPVWMGTTYVVAAVRQGHLRRAAAKAFAVAVAVTAAVGSWFWIRNLLTHGTPSPSLHATATAPPKFSPDQVGYARYFPVFLTQGFWGYFGYYYIQIGDLLTGLATMVVGSSFVSALLGRPRRPGTDRDGVRRLHIVGVVAFPALLLAFVAFVAHSQYERTAQMWNFVQGRYLFGAVVPMAMVTAVGSVRLLGRRAGIALVALAFLLQVQGIRLVLERWWGVPGGPIAESWESLIAWNPWPVPLVTLTGVALVGLSVWLAVEVVHVSRSLRPAEPRVQAGSRFP